MKLEQGDLDAFKRQLLFGALIVEEKWEAGSATLYGIASNALSME